MQAAFGWSIPGVGLALWRLLSLRSHGSYPGNASPGSCGMVLKGSTQPRRPKGSTERKQL